MRRQNCKGSAARSAELTETPDLIVMDNLVKVEIQVEGRDQVQMHSNRGEDADGRVRFGHDGHRAIPLLELLCHLRSTRRATKGPGEMRSSLGAHPQEPVDDRPSPAPRTWPHAPRPGLALLSGEVAWTSICPSVTGRSSRRRLSARRPMIAAGRTLLLDQTSAPAVATQKQLQNVRRDKSA